MFDNIKKKLCFLKMDLLFYKGIKEGKIVPFDEEFYKKMSNKYIACIPISIRIKYLKPLLPPGQCMDRSLYMFFCFDDALLVRADVKNLELAYGKEAAMHGWIEIGNYVYDPSLTLKFDKDLYYEIYSPTNIRKTNKEDYRKVNSSFYDEVISTTIEDFQPGGRKRTDLCLSIPAVMEITELSNNEDFKKELNEYLEKIQYDEKQIQDELRTEFLKSINNDMRFF